MKTQLISKGMGVLTVALLTFVGTGSVFAGPYIPLNSQPQPRLRPHFPPPVVHPIPVTPRLGIMGHIEYGYGMVVDSVNYGTVANRMGLERGDVIVRINNRQINSDSSYQQALFQAHQTQGGFVDLVVIDVRTGMTRHRAGNLNGGFSGPSLPRYVPPTHTPYAPVTHSF